MTQLCAHIVSGTVREIVSPLDGFTLADCYAPDFVAACVPCDATVTEGMLWDGHAFTAAAAPAPTAAELFAQKIAIGLAVASTGTPAISATYALDQTTLDEIHALASDCAAGLGYPADEATFDYPDSTGAPRSLTPASMIALYKALRDYVYRLKATRATLDAGGSADWPPPTVTIA